MGTTVNISLEEFQALQLAKAQAEAETAEVRKQLEAARFVDGNTRVREVTAFARECLTIARFAIANCPPETNRGWPYETVRRVSAGLSSLPDYSLQDRDMAIDLMVFAHECETFEVKRRAAREGTLQPIDGP